MGYKKADIIEIFDISNDDTVMINLSHIIFIDKCWYNKEFPSTTQIRTINGNIFVAHENVYFLLKEMLRGRIQNLVIKPKRSHDNFIDDESKYCRY